MLDGTLPATMNASTGGEAVGFGGIVSLDYENGEDEPPQGTSENAGFRSHLDPEGMMRRAPRAEMRSIVGARKRQLDPAEQPLPPSMTEEEEPDADKRCEYNKWVHVLGGDGSAPLGALWALEGYVDLVAADVKQGGLGNCGMGSSVMALAAGGWTQYLRNCLKRVGPGEGSYEVRLFKDGEWQTIAIDDQLPTRTGGAASNCRTFPGYQPVLDAVLDPAAPGGYRQAGIFFMPLLEKAFAKFLDANPDWSNSPEWGYFGTEGVHASNVLSALTGGTPRLVRRKTTGYDPHILGALLTCAMGKAPCVVGSANPAALTRLGESDTTNTVWLNPVAGDYGYEAGRTSGMVASDAPASTKTYTIIDFDQLVQVDGRDRSTAVTMVGKHAYAFDHASSTRWPFAPGGVDLLTFDKAKASLLNPWGRNPCSWPGGLCGKDGGIYGMPARLPLSFRTFAMSINTVYTVTDMPPP
jgi:hypothetical protein